MWVMRSSVAVASAMALVVGVLAASTAHASAVNDQQAANTQVSNTASSAAASVVAGIIDVQIGSALQPSTTAASGQDQQGATAYLDTRNQYGQAAGGANKGFGLWARGAWTTMENDEAGGEFDGNVVNVTLGGDYKLNSNAVIGLSAGWENMDIDTTFNAGTYEGQGYTVAPYVGLKLSDQLQVSATAGYSQIDYDVKRTTNGTVTGSTDSDRYFGAANVSYTIDPAAHGVNGLRVTPEGGVLWVTEKQASYVDSTGTTVAENKTDLGRLKAGVTVGYRIDAIEPFASAAGEWDFQRGDSVDLGNGRFSNVAEYGAEFGLGVNFLASDMVSGSLEGKTSQFREDFSSYSVTGRVRIDF